MSNQQFSMNPWSEEFQSTKLNVRANKTLITELANSINCNLRRLCRIIGDPSNNYLTRDNPNANYVKIRNTADFLGVPPWLIFTEEGNEKIIRLYEKVTTSPLETYIISSIGESLQKLREDLGPAMITQEERDIINAHLDEIEDTLRKNGEHTKNTWGEIFGFLQEEFKKDTVNWGCNLYLNNGSFTATFRISKWKEKINEYKTKSWSSAWIYFKQRDTNLPYPNVLLEIFNDINALIGKPYWNFPIYIDSLQSSANLYSWHSDRVDVYDREQHHRIGKNLPLPPKFKISPEPVICLMPNFNTKAEEYLDDIGDIDDLINWIEEDENVEGSGILVNSFYTLELLLDRGFLKENDRLIYKYPSDYTDSGLDNKKAYCTLVIQNGEPKVKWAYDDNIYSISSLTKQMLLECGRISPSTNPNGNKYWRLVGSDATSLYDIAVNINKDDHSGQSKLF